MKNKHEHPMNPKVAKVGTIILQILLGVCVALAALGLLGLLLRMLLCMIRGVGKGDVGGKEEEEENSTPSSGAGAVCEGK